jgi:hypothetical protein
MERGFVLRAGRDALPLKLVKRFLATPSYYLDIIRFRVTDEVGKWRGFPMLFPHEQKR